MENGNLTFLWQVKHRFRFFCSGNAGASASTAIAVAPAAPSATAPALPPIAGAGAGAAPPELNDRGLGDAATDELEAVDMDAEDAGG